ncbi:ATP-binding cassette domain-containing protein [Paracraurococcus lichenis]|uniref:ATP-binding cassette domain-containing protein n=1 Tax=Paracraurococcus lichenis TaxID=3064888 RepID=A0ABT9E5G0_9PROT|nr:ATP-binding cassette domain-containing protein [Paracraurococcus sp. LOR1-02]MDO9711415.1 ATP-binding cassette domain-containing protein [Paracraurococcus sp. LOR1-02]
MAAQNGTASAEALLRAAIEDTLRVIGGWITLMLGLGVASTLLGFAILMNKTSLFALIPTTLSRDTLFAAAVFWVIALVAATVLKLLQQRAVAAVSRYVAERLVVPVVLCTSQRAGRPEVLSNAAIEAIEQIRRALSGELPHIAVGLLSAPLLLALICALHWAAFVLSVGFCVLGAVVSLLMTRAGQGAATVAGRAKVRAFGLAADAMRSGEAVLAMGMLPRLSRQWLEAATEGAAEAWAHERRAERLKTALEVLNGVFRGSILFIMAALMLMGADVNMAFASSILVIGMVVGPFMGLGANLRTLSEGLDAWRRLREMVRSTAAIPEGIAFPRPAVRLTAEHLSFGYRGPQPALFRNLNMTVGAGEIVAVIGPSGSGKSTLLRLLMGILRPGGGGAYLDGHATSQWDRRELARHVGFLPQDPQLSRATVAEAIARLEDPDMPEVIEAARRAGAHETIIGLPLGYATPLVQNHQLSMGQRHRIALARALYGRPQVLLLDELAGSLDAEGEAEVGRLLRRLRDEGAAVVFTTHRPSLIAIADRVLAVRQGSLVPTGEEQPRLEGRSHRGNRARRPVAAAR